LFLFIFKPTESGHQTHWTTHLLQETFILFRLLLLFKRICAYTKQHVILESCLLSQPLRMTSFRESINMSWNASRPIVGYIPMRNA